MNDHDRKAPLRDLLNGSPLVNPSANEPLAGSDLSPATIERLRHAGADLRAAEARVYAALHHGNSTGIADGIAHTKNALAHLVSIR